MDKTFWTYSMTGKKTYPNFKNHSYSDLLPVPGKCNALFRLFTFMLPFGNIVIIKKNIPNEYSDIVHSLIL